MHILATTIHMQSLIFIRLISGFRHDLCSQTEPPKNKSTRDEKIADPLFISGVPPSFSLFPHEGLKIPLNFGFQDALHEKSQTFDDISAHLHLP